MDKARQTLQELAAHMDCHREIRSAHFPALEADLPDHVGNMLRRSRSDRGWSQRRTAELLCISRAQYLRYESGAAMPRLHTASLWSLVFGAPPAILLAPSQYGRRERQVPPHFFQLSDWLCRAPTTVFYDTLNHLQQLLSVQVELPDPEQCHLTPSLMSDAIKEVQGYEIYLTVGANLRLVRQLLGYSQEDMANALGISTSHFLSIERGDVTYSFVMLPRFAYSMQLPPLALTINTRYYKARQALSVRFNAVLDLLDQLPETLREPAMQHVVSTMTLYTRGQGARQQ
ncbi:MAG: helix-turn-helix domain-containing protein [Natronospirillum sp.]|uniref:helix-turn-helix domain-containing protein n=1 Tax=Natronospirillum sp. TaxID=2812955 RepID=UPI0025EBA5A1|nr:helix-turn-helix transcriptional regulator [Natronospirillum sp.]MCH8551459.1 helix-turn-helix domain-containing protein [Natronospirillum sp.]